MKKVTRCHIFGMPTVPPFTCCTGRIYIHICALQPDFSLQFKTDATHLSKTASNDEQKTKRRLNGSNGIIATNGYHWRCFILITVYSCIFFKSILENIFPYAARMIDFPVCINTIHQSFRPHEKIWMFPNTVLKKMLEYIRTHRVPQLKPTHFAREQFRNGVR